MPTLPFLLVKRKGIGLSPSDPDISEERGGGSNQCTTRRKAGRSKIDPRVVFVRLFSRSVCRVISAGNCLILSVAEWNPPFMTQREDR